jgi:hypothetical protein
MGRLGTQGKSGGIENQPICWWRVFQIECLFLSLPYILRSLFDSFKILKN